eukprot:g11983.t1
MILRPSADPMDPESPAGETRLSKFGKQISEDHYGVAALSLLKEFSFRPVMATYMTMTEPAGTCAECLSELKPDFKADVERYNGSYTRPADTCNNCNVGGDDACFGCIAAGGGALPPGSDPDYTFMDFDPSLPGNQNILVCEAYTDADSCYNDGCQWWPETGFIDIMTWEGGLNPAHWTVPSGQGGLCKPCVSFDRAGFHHPVPHSAQCRDQNTVCACGGSKGGCAIAAAYNFGARVCPFLCPSKDGSADAISKKACVSAGVNPDDPGRRLDEGSSSSKYYENKYGLKDFDLLAAGRGKYRHLSHADRAYEIKRQLSTLPTAEGKATAEQCAVCKDYVAQNNARNRTHLDGTGNVKDSMSASYEIGNCKGMLVAIRMRAECELNHPDWRRLSNGFAAPQLKDRDDWVREMIDEYNDNYKKQDKPTAKTYAGEPSRWKELEDKGVGVTLYHPYFLGQEMTELVEAELLSLGLTFFLMYAFLVAAIGPMVWRRYILSLLVLVQPFLAMFLAMGCSALPMWWWVPGDLDNDGEDDMVVPTTVLTALGLHLMLAVVVDYDIILVRAFDRITKQLPYPERIAVAAGYAHRTISVSMLVGIAAFALGSFVDLPVLTYFCWQSFVAMIGLYVGMFSCFLGLMALLEKSDPMNAEAANTENVSPKSPFSKLVVKNPADLKFANALSKPFVVVAILVVEFALTGVYLFGDKLEAEFEGSKYLLPDSKVRLFTNKVDGMGGLPDTVNVWLPPSEIGQYHIPENRKYYMTVIDQMRAIPEVKAIEAGLPSLFSWLHEYEAQLRGIQGFDVPNSNSASYDPTAGEFRPAHAYSSDYSHKGCASCPRVVRSAFYDKAVRLPETMTDAQVDTVFGADGLAVERSGPITQFHVSALNHTSGIEIFSGSTGAVVPIPTAEVLDETFQNTLTAGGFHIATVTKVAAAANECGTVYLSSNPSGAGELFSNHTTVASLKFWLKAELANLRANAVPNERIEIRFKSVYAGRFKIEDAFAGEKAACSNRTDFLGQREGFWATTQGAPYFYEFLHDFYENWDAYSTCCAAMYKPHTLLDKQPGQENKPHVAVFPKIESKAGRLAWATQGSKVTGLQSSIIKFYFKYSLGDSKMRIKVMHLLQDHLEKHRTMYPERWGKKDETGKADDSFVVARFFPNADRDENMDAYLQHHLLFVYIATIISCFIFMHPFYGTMTAVFLMICMCQIQGLMALFDIKLDICSFAVLVMAMGFAIEYVVHIAHAFLHCKGRGLERTKNAQVEEMGLTVFSAFLSTAVQQTVLLAMNQSLVFQTYATTMMLVIIKSGMTGFLLVPSLLGLIDAAFAKISGADQDSNSEISDAVDAGVVAKEEAAKVEMAA